MKTKTIITVLLVAFILSSCAPPAKVVPTETAVPTSTYTPVPTTPTFTPTPAPENISDSKGLPVWVDEFVHAYGGKVTVNSVEMDAIQLTDEIRKNGDKFIETKLVNGAEYLLLIINGIPLAMQEGNDKWQEATMAKLGDLNNITFEFAVRGSPPQEMIDRIKGKNTIVVLTTPLATAHAFRSFAQNDWVRIIDDWSQIQLAFDKKDIDSLNFPIDWEFADQTIRESQEMFNNKNLQFRSQSLYNGTIPVESLRKLKAKMNYSNDDMLKIFEFTVRAKVIRYPQVGYWDVEDEIVDSYVMATFNNLPDFNFWSIATGIRPSELTLKVAEWVKHDSPNAKTYMTEGSKFEFTNPAAYWANNYFEVFIKEVAQNNEKNGVKLIDGFIGENNWWIYEPQDWNKIEKSIDEIQSLGFVIGSSETIIVTGDIPINDCCGRKKLVDITNRDQAQAQMYADWLRLYLRKNVKVIGFSGFGDDYYAWTNDVGLPDANPFFFDHDFKPKESYYSMVQVLYEQLP
jgi:hypothetical protein